MNRVCFVFLLPAIFAVSCKSVSNVLNEAGRLLDGSAFAEKTIKNYKSADDFLNFRIFSTKNGERGAVFTLKTVPYIKFYCTEPYLAEDTSASIDEDAENDAEKEYNGNAGGLFFITRIHFLFSNVSGWQEGDMNVSGYGAFVDDEFSVDGGIIIGEITRGSIQRRDKYLSGERALTELRNRGERIAAVSEWMKEYTSPEDILPPFDDFEKYWRPVLLPETSPAALRPFRFNELNKTRPDADSDGKTAGSGIEYSYGEHIKWNMEYTQELFPENLRPLRDSGTLFRDWEEAAAWLYIYYNWGTIVKILNEKYNMAG
ncbi:MAG: hypothetical protein LBC27_10210 [Spirochaetaceae bacterium]|jgi:hypothetical protein|nr:hypothetical protein [Spirochaetaceae bacterium]